MKLKKRPIFLEITKNSFFAIILILTIYTVSQLVVFWIFIDKHEIDLVKSRYQEIINLSNSINIEFSEKGFIEYLERLDYNENDEYIRIYSPNELYYQSPSEVWQYINFDYANQNIHIKSKSFDFEIYKLITGPIQINNSEYTLQIVLENEMFGDFIDNSLPILIVSIILGLILSGIGAMYVSKKFIYKIRKLIETMNEIKANGLNKRAEISEVNDEIDKLRHSATASILEREDTIIVSSVSCIYGIGDPKDYKDLMLSLREGMQVDRDDVIKKLIEIQYERNDINFVRGTFRVRGDVVEIFPVSNDERAIRVEFFGDEIDRITEIDYVTGKIVGTRKYTAIFPASHYVTTPERIEKAIDAIEKELAQVIQEFKDNDQLLEEQRIEQRTKYDIEMLREVGFCQGIEFETYNR